MNTYVNSSINFSFGNDFIVSVGTLLLIVNRLHGVNKVIAHHTTNHVIMIN